MTYVLAERAGTAKDSDRIKEVGKVQQGVDTYNTKVVESCRKVQKRKSPEWRMEQGAALP